MNSLNIVNNLKFKCLKFSRNRVFTFDLTALSPTTSNHLLLLILKLPYAKSKNEFTSIRYPLDLVIGQGRKWTNDDIMILKGNK